MSVATPSPDVESRLQRCIGRVAATWSEGLVALSPVLGGDVAAAAIEQLVGELVALALSEPFEPTAAYALGQRLEALDSLQPSDVAAAQGALCDAFAACLPATDWDWLYPRLTRLLFAVGAGFYAGQASRAGRFQMHAMSRMGHDLKTPINAITGFSRVILKGIDGPVTDFQREDLTSIYEAGQRLLTMINDLFTVRKQDAGRTLLLERPFEVSDLLADTLRTLQPVAGERGHTWSVTTVGPLGLATADPSMVRWVLLSLLLYVMRQGVDGMIALRVSQEAGAVSRDGGAPEDGAAALLTFEVAYTPSGQWHAEGEAAPAPQDPSADIALIVCRRFCEALGGTLVRTDGEGTTFTAQLPIASALP